MAGIEKICEFSGEYPGWDMYRFKRNHIQIMPKYRKLFRGAKATLVVEKVEKRFLLDGGFMCDLECGATMGKGRVVTEYTFSLRVSNPELQGDVKGRYVNQTQSLRQTKKRLKRMLRCRELETIWPKYPRRKFDERSLHIDPSKRA